MASMVFIVAINSAKRSRSKRLVVSSRSSQRELSNIISLFDATSLADINIPNPAGSLNVASWCMHALMGKVKKKKKVLY